MRRWVCVALLSCLAVVGSAQDRPKGPAGIIGGAQRARSARELTQAGQRAEATAEKPAHPQVGASAPADHAGLGEDGASRPPLASAAPDTSLPAGTIAVRVLDQAGKAVPVVEVNLGIMAADSKRTSQEARTAADGTVTFSGLSVGDGQAYRVNVPYQGAKYSSTPFRLPAQGGYRVEIRRLPVTHDERMVVLYVGATSIELKDDRVKVVQQARLFNLGGATYVFPTAGKLVRLPTGFMAMQSQEVMTDQRIVEKKGEGLLVQGSLPPGEVTLLWGFDLPLSGTEARFTLDMPWLTFAYRVIADAPSGMTLSVSGMPEPVSHLDAGRKFLVTELQRKIGDPPFERLDIVLRGIPGPGPGRIIAAVLAVLGIAAGFVVAKRSIPSRAIADGRNWEAQKAALLDRARTLRAQHQRGEIGPETYAQESAALVDGMATVLLEQSRSS